MQKTLTSEFFNRPTLTVSRELLGKYLVRKVNGKEIALMITEVEAYSGFNDRASHARSGQTLRNAPMFGKPGTIYVYFTYGMHWMLNIVCREEGHPAAVLVRGTALPEVFSYSQEYQNAKPLNGPAKLTKFLQIDKSLNNKPLGKASGLWVEDRGVVLPRGSVVRTPRIGIDHAGPEWAGKPWRFVLKNR